MPDIYEKDEEERNPGNQYDSDTEQPNEPEENSEASDEHKGRFRDRLRRHKDASSAEELGEAEKDASEKKPRTAFDNLPQSDENESPLGIVGGESRFFKDTDKPKRFRLSRIARGGFRRNGRVALGVGGGIVGFLLVGFTLFSFLNVFKLDHLLKNIDAKTLARYNAQFSNRSKAYVQAYIKLRMMQYDGRAPGDPEGNIFFRANKVNTGNAVRDWYATLKTNNFEQKVLNKEGVFFTSSVDPNGHLRPAKITFKDGGDVTFDVTKYLDKNGLADLTSNDPSKVSQAINKLGPEMDGFLNREFFNSDKAARKSLAQTVENNTHFFQVVKRRRIRKNIQNEIGVRNWTFFETTAAKYRDKKTSIQQKILSKLFPDNNELANLMQCIFVGTGCRTNTDPENKVATEPLPVDANSTQEQQTNKDGSPATDSNGKPITKPIDLGGSELATDGVQAVESAATEDASKAAESSSLSQRVVNKVVSKFVDAEVGDTVSGAVGDVSKWWKLARRFATFNNMIKNHTISKIIKNARLQQLEAIGAMYSIAADQMKTGQVSSAEVKDLMGTLGDFGNTEGWQKISGNNSSGSVSAATTTPTQTLTKQQYCNPAHVKQPNEFAWLCDDQKPNGGSTAGDLEASWNSTVGYITNPIADAVGTINSIPIVGGVINSFTNFIGSITGAISKLTIDPILSALGITKDLGQLMTFAMGKIMSFFGLAPIFTGTQPGLANFLIAGKAGTAEGSTRAAGGVASTPSTINYSNSVATAYLNDQRSQESVFDRYASINNPDSLAAKSLFSVANSNMTSFVSSLTNIFGNAFSVLGNVFSGKIFAASTPAPASDIAQWAGVDTYDIPQQCQDLDPLALDYLTKAVGVQQDSPWAGQAQGIVDAIRGNITPDVVRDETGFWKLVYDKIGTNENAGDIAGAIYNCALLDRQVEGGLGYMYGYTDDGGLDAGSQPASSPTPAVSSGYSNPFRDIPNLTVTRIDQGVDYNGTGPVYALGNATLVDVNANSGWPGNGQGSGGTFISYVLKDGPAAGKYVYVAEDCNVAVSMSQPDITANTVLCNMYNGRTAIEIGWAEPGLGEHGLAHDEYTCDTSSGSISTSLGQNFSKLLQSLGAKPGVVQVTGQNTSCSGSPSTKPLPAGWPTW